MPPVGFEPTISAGERPQTYALDRAATGTVCQNLVHRTDMNCIKSFVVWLVIFIVLHYIKIQIRNLF